LWDETQQQLVSFRSALSPRRTEANGSHTTPAMAGNEIHVTPLFWW